jgi:hypothetical protein
MYSRYLATTGQQNLQQNLARYPRGYWPRTKREKTNVAPANPKRPARPGCPSANHGDSLPPGTDGDRLPENGGSQE